MIVDINLFTVIKTFALNNDEELLKQSPLDISCIKVIYASNNSNASIQLKEQVFYCTHIIELPLHW